MTTRITISVSSGQQPDKIVRVTPGTSIARMEHGVPVYLKLGQTQEFFVYDSQTLIVEEVDAKREPD